MRYHCYLRFSFVAAICLLGLLPGCGLGNCLETSQDSSSTQNGVSESTTKGLTIATIAQEPDPLKHLDDLMASVDAAGSALHGVTIQDPAWAPRKEANDHAMRAYVKAVYAEAKRRFPQGGTSSAVLALRATLKPHADKLQQLATTLEIPRPVPLPGNLPPTCGATAVSLRVLPARLVQSGGLLLSQLQGLVEGRARAASDSSGLWDRLESDAMEFCGCWSGHDDDSLYRFWCVIQFVFNLL